MPVYRHRRFKQWLNSPARDEEHISAGRIGMLEELRKASNPWAFVQEVVAGKTHIQGYALTAARRYMDEFLKYETKGSASASTGKKTGPSLPKKRNDKNGFDPESFYAGLLGLPR